MENLRIFIGYDTKEPVAFHVLTHSILTRASGPVEIIPLVQSALREQGLYTRERGATESTEFSMTRFLVPALSEYKGISVFMDCDMLCLTDMYELVGEVIKQRHADAVARRAWDTNPIGDCPRGKAVLVCQHDYSPTTTVKFLGQVNTPYPRKNWSSVMVFDNSRCRALTPERVNSLSGLELHRFSWLNDDEVGSLPLEWNWLVGEYSAVTLENGKVYSAATYGDVKVYNPLKVLHYTLGGPWFTDYFNCDHADLWLAERAAMLEPQIAHDGGCPSECGCDCKLAAA